MIYSEYLNFTEKPMTKIIIGDCRVELPKLADDSIDCILTSPPFKDEDVEGNYWDFYDGIFNQMVRGYV